MSKEECCGTCGWHRFENLTDGWVCVNDESENCGDWTEYSDSCDMWEER